MIYYRPIKIIFNDIFLFVLVILLSITYQVLDYQFLGISMVLPYFLTVKGYFYFNLCPLEIIQRANSIQELKRFWAMMYKKKSSSAIIFYSAITLFYLASLTYLIILIIW